MYRAKEKQMSIYDYLPPYHGELRDKNRWVRLAEAIDWDRFEQGYSELFAPSGTAAISARIAVLSSCITRSRTARWCSWCGKAPTCSIYWAWKLSAMRCRFLPAR